MIKLWTLFIPILILAYFTQKNDEMLSERGKGKDKFFTCIIILVLVLFCGLRTFYNDTGTYRMMYENAESVKDYIKDPSNTFSQGWLFGLISSLFKELGFSFQDFLMLFSFLTVTPYVLFVRKYTPHFLIGVFLMFTTSFYTFTFAAMKQCAATAVCIMALDFAIRRKWVKYFLLIALASLFHPYAIIYALVPLMMFKPFTKRTYIYIAVFIAAGFGLEFLLKTVLDITDMMGANYDAETFVGEGVNIFRVLVSFVPLALGAIFKDVLFEDSSDTDNIMFNLAMLNALIMFVGLFGTANYFARLANYFLPAQVITLPWLLYKIGEKQKDDILKVLCVAGYTGYFIYDNTIRHIFDNEFAQISFLKYISSHF